MDGDLGATPQRADVADVRITGVTSDSRCVEPGFLFAAVAGTRADGRDFVGEAVRRGAAAVLAPSGTCTPAELRRAVPLMTDANVRRRLALIAARFYGRQPATVAAVTGTNGKTSVVWLLRQIWTILGRSAASLGTLGVQAPRWERAGSLTTPDPVALHETLAALAADGVECLAIEASSHGLDQYRLDGVDIEAAAFTNLTRDHLDYHGSMDAYGASKLRLFAELLSPGGTAVVNADDTRAGGIADAAERVGARVLRYGRADAEIRYETEALHADGQRLVIDCGRRAHRITLPLIGGFQAANAVCAAALATATGGDSAASISALTRLKPIPGRLQRVARRDDGAAAYVDYAHTPDALAAALTALRAHTEGRLLLVFGCGGNRDAGKRPRMGRIARDLADIVIVTDDNPRSEDPADIRRQILVACPEAEDIGDRREAIAAALSRMRACDMLLVAGKGHETGQIVGDRVLPFDDAAVIREAAPSWTP